MSLHWVSTDDIKNGTLTLTFPLRTPQPAAKVDTMCCVFTSLPGSEDGMHLFERMSENLIQGRTGETDEQSLYPEW